MDTDICGRPLVPGTEAYNHAERTGMIHYEDKTMQYKTMQYDEDETAQHNGLLLCVITILSIVGITLMCINHKGEE